MNGLVQETDAQRSRWERYRRREHLGEDEGDDFAVGGLGRHVEDLAMRLLFLPFDPDGDAVPLNGATLGWLKEDRSSPYEGPPARWGSYDRATTSALVRYEQSGDALNWWRYLALNRHGGLDVGVGRLAYSVHEARIFPLRRIVGVVWCAAALQIEVATAWGVSGPYEVALGLRDTAGAGLGGFAEGWAEPGNGLWDYSTAIDEHVLLRRETDTIDAEQLALDFGDRIEQAFGTTHRRHLAHRGDFEGRFDPRFQI